MAYFDDIVIENRDEIFHDDTVDKELEELVLEAKKYHIFNLIQRIACLNLFHQNQNMSVILDSYIDAILQHKVEEYASNYIVSPGKLRKLLNRLLETALVYSVDPPENLFVENVMFYGNYKTFNGIDHQPAYNLQMMIRSIFEYSNDYPEEFKSRAYRLIHFILAKSDHIANEIDSIENNHEEDESRNLYIPSAAVIEKYASLIVLEGNDVRSSLANDEYLIELINTDFAKPWNSDFDNRCFYSAPFLYDLEKDQYIILNVGLLTSALFYWIYDLATKYGIQKQLISDFNNLTFLYCRRYLKELGHEKIKEGQLGIALVNEDYYKELITCVHNNQFLIMLFLCDDGSNYSAETLHSPVVSDKYQTIVNNRMDTIISKLTEHGVGLEDIYFILVFNSIGRGINCGIGKTKMAHALLSFDPLELMCISINEEKKSSFLPRYIEAKASFSGWQSGILSELNAIELYRAQDYSFYMGDDINPAEINMFVAPGGSIDYVRRALSKEDRKMVESYDDTKFTEIVLDDAKRSIYVDTNLIGEIRLAYYLEYKGLSLWIATEQISDYRALDLYHAFADTMAYWLAESRQYIEPMLTTVNAKIKIMVSLSDEIEEYFYDKKYSKSLMDCLEIVSDDDKIDLICSADVLRYLNHVDNTHEKEFIRIVLSILFRKLQVFNPDWTFLDTVFTDPSKKKIFSLDYTSLPYLEPVDDRNYHYVHKEDEEGLLNWIGNKMLSEGNWGIGVIKDSDRTVVANKVVAILYERLQEEVGKLNPYHLVEIIYDDMEKVLFNVMLANHRYASDVACYPEKERQILDDINKANQASMALKFLIEYVAAKPPTGKKIVGEGTYENLIAICSLIIDWAYKNDLFYYHVVNTPIEFLKSRRIGMKQVEFQKMLSVNEKNRRTQLTWSSTQDLREAYDIPKTSFVEEVDSAFKVEFGYSLGELQLFVNGMRAYSQELPGNTVYVKAISEVEDYLERYSEKLTPDIINLIIEGISLKSRSDFLKPPKKYRKEDVYPWRFNREYSFTRRPIIIRENEILWGNRQLAHMLSYTMSLVYGGKLKARKNEMKKLMGKIADEKGKEFNNLIYEMVKQMNEFEVHKNVSNVNGKKIADENGSILGDIDVLIIDHRCRKIICAEAKDFHFSRNPYEVHQEYTKMFNSKDGYAVKHQRRVEWCIAHTDDFVKQYGLEECEWEFKSIFIVSEPLGSNEIYAKSIAVITEADLTIENIKAIYR